MSRPKILHVIHSTAFGGGPNMLAILCTRLAGEFEMEVVCDGQGDVPNRLEQEGVRVHRLPLTTKWSFARSIPRLAALVRRLQPDLVQLHGQFAGSLGQPALTLAGRPKSLYVVQWPSFLDDVGPWSRLRNRTAELVSCGMASAVVAVSRHDRDEYLRRRLCPPGKISIIHNSYSVEADGQTDGRVSTSEVIGFVGRLADQKGCEFLIAAMPSVLSRHPAARLVIVGDGPERPRLEDLVDRLAIRPAVRFAGYSAVPTEEIHSMDVVVIPSIYDPFPLVTLEVMAQGKPIVGSAVGGIPEAVVDGETGLLVPPRSAEAIAGAIERLLSEPQTAAKMGAAALARARHEFSPQAITAQYAALYRRLLATTSS